MTIIWKKDRVAGLHVYTAVIRGLGGCFTIARRGKTWGGWSDSHAFLGKERTFQAAKARVEAMAMEALHAQAIEENETIDAEAALRETIEATDPTTGLGFWVRRVGHLWNRGVLTSSDVVNELDDVLTAASR